MSQLHSLRQLPDGRWEAQFYGRKATGETPEAAWAALEASMPRREVRSRFNLSPEFLDYLLEGLKDREDN